MSQDILDLAFVDPNLTGRSNARGDIAEYCVNQFLDLFLYFPVSKVGA